MVHLGIIPDGNRRWCIRENTTMEQYVEFISEVLFHPSGPSPILTHVTEMSVYLLSSDNIKKRNISDLNMVYNLFRTLMELDFQENVPFFRFQFIGRKTLLPPDIQTICQVLEKKSSKGTFRVTLAIAYDPKHDLISGEAFTRDQSPIDIVIRSGGEKRMSGFFPFHTLYSELFFIDNLWPDIRLHHIEKILIEYINERYRRFGA
jgi:undecaprenyl pyrophosphate synthase